MVALSVLDVPGAATLRRRALIRSAVAACLACGFGWGSGPAQAEPLAPAAVSVLPGMPADFTPAGYVEDLGVVPADTSQVRGWATDPQGRLWVHSALGTLMYDGRAMVPIHEVYPWMAGQTLPRAGAGNSLGFQIDPEGRLWVGGQDRVVVADPGEKVLRTVLQRSLDGGHFRLFRQGGAMVIQEISPRRSRLWHVTLGPTVRLGAPLVLPDLAPDEPIRLLPVPLGVTQEHLDVLLPARQERQRLSPTGQPIARAPVDPALAGVGPWVNFLSQPEGNLLGGTSGHLIWDGQALKRLWPETVNMADSTGSYAPRGWVPAHGGFPDLLLSEITTVWIDPHQAEPDSVWFMNRGRATVTVPTGGMTPIDRDRIWAMDRATLSRIHLPSPGWYFLRDTRDPQPATAIVNVDDITTLVDGEHGLWTTNGGSLTNGNYTHFSSTLPGGKRYTEAPLETAWAGMVAGPGLACSTHIGQLDCHDPVQGRQRLIPAPASLAHLKGKIVVPNYVDAGHIYAITESQLIRIGRQESKGQDSGAWEPARAAQPGTVLPGGRDLVRRPSGASSAMGPTRRLWFGTRGGALIEWDVQRNTWQRVALPAHPLLDRDTLPQVLDDQGVWVWLKSGRHLLRYRPSTRTLQAVGGVDSALMRLTRSGRGRLWLLTDSEVLALDEDKATLQALDLPASLNGVLGHQIAAVDGRVYLATREGLLSIDADRPPLRQAVAPPTLVKLDWVDDSRTPRSVRQPETDLALHYTSALNLSFTTRHTLASDGVQYRYRLRPEGGKPADAPPWHELPPGQIDASLTSLDPGRYVLEYAARLPRTRWVDAAQPLRLAVEPAPWQTAWARTGMVLTAVLLIGGSLVMVQMRARMRVSAVQRVAHSLVAHVGEGIVLMDAQWRIVLANAATQRLLGRRLRTDGSHSLQELLDAQVGDTPLTALRIATALEHGGPAQFELLLPARGPGPAPATADAAPAADSPVILGASFQRITTEDGQPGCAVVLTDISDSKAHERELLHRARYDSLTQLVNRSHFGTCLQHAMAEALAQSGAVALVYLDIDHFRDVNDTRGHQVGDALLVTLARRLDDAAPPSARVGRFGGDEFAVLLPCPDPDLAERQALALAQELRTAISLPWEEAGLRLLPAASLGVAIYPQHAQDAGELYQCADLALYESKRLGRNRIELFDSRLMTLAQRRVDLGDALKTAIPRGELRLFLQAKVDAATLQVIGAEALVRWERPEQMVSPADFIPLAEANGLIGPIGTWVQESACRWQRHRLDAGLPLLPVSVNASSSELETPGFAAQIERLLQRHRLPAAALEIEVTESAHFVQRDLARHEMQRLRDLGVAVVADDFGTGYASLSYLTEFPLSGIKIDPTILRSMAQDERRRSLVSGLVRNVMDLGMSAVAEGVETAEQQALARGLGVSAMQGWLYARAVPAEQFTTHLALAKPRPPGPGQAQRQVKT